MNPPIIFSLPVSSLPPRQPATMPSDNETRQGKYVKINILPKGESIMEIKNIQIQKPEEINFILGQSHFIKTVEDLHETLVASVPGIKFGLAFCEASGDCLVRWSGTDDAMIELARQNAKAIGAGHSFIIFLGEGYFPINILNQVKMVPEVCRIYCATANPTDVIVMDVGEGRAILGVADGKRPEGIEDEEGIAWRKNFLRMIGYKH
jgi:adenosine/AMP kinase